MRNSQMKTYVEQTVVLQDTILFHTTCSNWSVYFHTRKHNSLDLYFSNKKSFKTIRKH